MNNRPDLDLVLLDFAGQCRVRTEAAMHKLLALLLDETALRARIEFLRQLARLRRESSGPAVAARPSSDYDDVIRILLEEDPFRTLEQGRLSTGRLDAFSRDPDALLRAHELLTGPEPEPAMSHGPLNFSQLMVQGQWPELEDRLRPFLPELLRFVGLKAQSEALLQFLLERARTEGTWQRRFRDLLPGWLEAFSEGEQTPMSRRFRQEDWEEFIDRAAVRLVLAEQPADEPEWARNFRLRAAEAASWRDVARVVPPGPPAAALLRFQQHLITRIRQVREHAASTFELDINAA